MQSVFSVVQLCVKEKKMRKHIHLFEKISGTLSVLGILSNTILNTSWVVLEHRKIKKKLFSSYFFIEKFAWEHLEDELQI